MVREDEVNVFADSVAVELPARFGLDLRLPAVSMGDDEMPVDVSLLRAMKQGAALSRFSAAGFGSLTRQAPAGDASAQLSYDELNPKWVEQPAFGYHPGCAPQLRRVPLVYEGGRRRSTL